MHIRKASFCLCLCLAWALAAAGVGETAYVRYHSGQDISWPVAVSQAVFENDGQIYHQALAQATLGMALSAFRVPDVALANRGDHISAYLGELGFAQITLQEYDVQPTMQTIATAIAMKPMQDALGAYTLLAVAISGGGYQDEWKSNFLIGNGLHHEGFDYAAKQVYNRLITYIAQHGVLARYKVWLGGYSRAAATANRLAAILLDNQTVAPANLFCYTFATPNTTRQQDAATYPSIFNIVGSFDPVPMIPFEEWGFTRFGDTRYLPTPETNSDYAAKVAPVKALYRQITGTAYWINQSDNRLMQKLFGVLTNMVSSIDDYANHYQSLLIDLWNRKSDPLSMLVGLVQTVAGDPTLWQQLSGQADQALAVVSNTAGEALLQDVGLFQQSWQSGVGLTENLLHEHYPSGYLAWLLAYPDGDAMASHGRRYRQVLVGGDASLAVYDAQNTLMCAFALDNGTPTGDSTQSYLTISQTGDSLSVSIPADQAYRVEITAQQGDPVAFVIREGTIGAIDMRSFEAAEASLPVGALCTCTLPTPFAAEGTAYTLQWAGGQAACQPVDTPEALAPLEVDSTAKQLLGQNLLALAGIALIALLETLFMLTIAIRAARRHRHKVRLRRALPAPQLPVRYHRLRAQRGQPARGAVKLCALLLLAAAAFAMVEAVQTALAWATDYRDITQAMLFWYVTLLNIPLVFLPLLAALPALLAALYALLWPEEDHYALKTAFYYTLVSVPSTAVLLFALGSEAYRGFHPWLLGSAVAQAALLGLLGVLAPLALRRHAKAQAAGKAE